MDSKMVIFYDESFPYEGQRPVDQILEKLAGQATVIKAAEIAEVLVSHDVECFIHLHGSYFPKSAWGSSN